MNLLQNANNSKQYFYYIYITIMHLADTFIQSDLDCIQCIQHVHAFSENQTYDRGIVTMHHALLFVNIVTCKQFTCIYFKICKHPVS